MILSNKARCTLCGDIIESMHRHDFVKCSCGNAFVDGGKDYLRYGAENGMDTIIHLAEVKEDGKS